METIEFCAICGSTSVCHEVVDETFTYKGHEIITQIRDLS